MGSSRGGRAEAEGGAMDDRDGVCAEGASAAETRHDNRLGGELFCVTVNSASSIVHLRYKTDGLHSLLGLITCWLSDGRCGSTEEAKHAKPYHNCCCIAGYPDGT